MIRRAASSEAARFFAGKLDEPVTPFVLPGMPFPSRPISLRTELLVAFAILVAAALAMAVAIALLFLGVVENPYANLYLAALIASDVVVFVLLANYYLRRLVSRPLMDVVAAAEAIAAGDLTRRVPRAATRELIALADSFNRMTDALLAERAQVIHSEKLASVGRLAAGVAHEIGNPLGAVNGYAHIIRTTFGPGASEAVDGIERETERMDRIVRGLLDYARPRRPHLSTVDVAEVARMALSLLRDQGALARIVIHAEIQERPAVVSADLFELEQVFVNLLLNAIDACGGAGQLTVHVGIAPRVSMLDAATRRSSDNAQVDMQRQGRPRADRWLDSTTSDRIVRIIVADSGPGIPEAARERIFDPFFTTKEPGKGTGLGLAIVARIIDNIHGTLWAQESRGGGAAIHLLLPEVSSGSIRTSASAAAIARVSVPAHD